MAEIIETNLPGVRLRRELVGESGDRVGVITHHSGRRDLLTFDSEDRLRRRGGPIKATRVLEHVAERIRAATSGGRVGLSVSDMRRLRPGVGPSATEQDTPGLNDRDLKRSGARGLGPSRATLVPERLADEGPEGGADYETMGR